MKHAYYQLKWGYFELKYVYYNSIYVYFKLEYVYLAQNRRLIIMLMVKLILPPQTENYKIDIDKVKAANTNGVGPWSEAVSKVQ